MNTHLNPADDASRGLSARRMVDNVRWLKGPQFLWHEEDFWPTEPPSSSSDVTVDDPELRREFQAHHIIGHREELEPLDVMINRYSSWFRLKKAIAWLLRFKEYFIKRQTPSKMDCDMSSNCKLTSEETQIVERKLINYVQRRTFGEVMSILLAQRSDSFGAKRALRMSGSFGSIYKLGPWIDENGLLRVGGRLQNAPIGYDQKHQLILPNRHKLIELIVREGHELSGHVGKKHILSRLRRSYWIVKGQQLSRE